MAQTINTNLASLISQNSLNDASNRLSTPLERLSSGLRINSARDDAAGLAIATRLATQLLGSNQALRNTNDGISLAQVAEGGLNEVSNNLQRLRELAVQSSNATNSASDREALQAEANQLIAEIDRTASTTEFNGRNLLDGSFAGARFVVGANGETIQASGADFNTDNFGNFRISADASGGNGAVASSAVLSTTTNRITADETLTLSAGAEEVNIEVAAGDSLQVVAERINDASETTGVTAEARTETELSFAGSGNFTLELATTETQGAPQEFSSVSFEVSANDSEGLEAAISAFNDQSGATGVTAQLNEAGDGITLVSDTGENIVVRDTTSANAADVQVDGVTLSSDTTVDTATAAGELTLDSAESFTLSSDAAGASQVVANGQAGAELNPVEQVDISQEASAQDAIATIDAALDAVNSQRAEFGAIQSRFESTLNNLSVNSENTAAARSRIADADFAQESAELLRAQILQQTGLSMLTQANVLPRNVLALLSG